MGRTYMGTARTRRPRRRSSAEIHLEVLVPEGATPAQQRQAEQPYVLPPPATDPRSQRAGDILEQFAQNLPDTSAMRPVALSRTSARHAQQMAEFEAERFVQNSDGTLSPKTAPYDYPRAMVAAAEPVDLNKSRATSTAVHQVQAWQRAAWDYFDQVGEIKFAFNSLSQMVSRVRLYAAVNDDENFTPVEASSFLKDIEETKKPVELSKACESAKKAVDSLIYNADGQQSGLLGKLSLNLLVAGECFLLFLDSKWMVASIDELVEGGVSGSWTLRRRRDITDETPIPVGTFVARIWRSHPRFGKEADASMRGALDSCEMLTLNEQTIRHLQRSQLGAGVVFIPTGINPAAGGDINEAVAAAMREPIEDEASIASVSPLIANGPAEVGKEMRRLELARPVDEALIGIGDRALDRILACIDVPKELVSGLADVKFANAVVLSDDLLKAHVEPLVLMICDALTTVYLKPSMLKDGIAAEIVQRFCVWYDPSQITTRPDKSQAANDGYQHKTISAKAWRRARGFTEDDAPDPDELIRRVALEKAQPDPGQSLVLLESLNPKFFAEQRAAGQAQSGVTSEVTDLLESEPNVTSTDQPTAPGATPEGGPVSPNGEQGVAPVRVPATAVAT